MDDKDFDNLIKGKLNNYSDPQFDAGALADFRSRISSFHPLPWYSKYRSEIFISSSLAFFTMINALLIWYAVYKKETIASKQTISIRHQIDSLREVIDQLKERKEPSPIYIINPIDQQPRVVGKITVPTYSAANHSASGRSSSNSKLYLRPLASLPSGVVQRLMEEDVLAIENGEAYLILTDKIRYLRHPQYASNATNDGRYTSIEPKTVPIKELKEIKLPKGMSHGKLSGKMLNKIEDHRYTRGIGINLAPQIDLIQSVFSRGAGNLAPRFGLTAEFVLSPRWGIETSIDYFKTAVTFTDGDQLRGLPFVNSQLGTFQTAQIESQTVSLPVHINYRRWFTHQHQFVAKAGYAPYFSFQNKYLYTYDYGVAGADFSINTSEQKDEWRFFGQNLSLSVGIMKLLKNKNKIEASLFYEKSLAHVGVEKYDLQLIGLRTAFWFKLR